MIWIKSKERVLKTELKGWKSWADAHSEARGFWYSFTSTADYFFKNQYTYICLTQNHIYIYSHPQTDLFCSIRTHQCGLTVSSRSWNRNPVDSKVKPKLLTYQPRGDISCEVNLKRLWITITIVYIYPFKRLPRPQFIYEEACNRR